MSIVKKIHIIQIIAFSVVCGLSRAELNDNCITPKKETGVCQYLTDCEELLQMLLKQNTENEKEYLRKSECGRDNNQSIAAKQVMVCCPKKVTTELRTRKDENFEYNLPEPGICGTDFSNRIYGGSITQIDQYPWMALIQYRKSKLYFDFHCGGSLINSRYVLTAAHCVKGADMPETWEVYAVRLGEWDLQTNPDCVQDVRNKTDCAPPHRDVLVEEVIAHESYIPTYSPQHFDIALIRLIEVVTPFTDFIRPICLPFDPKLRENMYAAVDATVAGWGATETSRSSDKKLEATIPVWPKAECASKYLSYQLSINGSHQLCAGGLRFIDACRGDSGGPLMVTETVNNRRFLFIIGIVSFGPRPCALNGWPGVYTRVTYFIDWIQKNLRE